MNNILEKGKEIWTAVSDKIWEVSDQICSKIGIDTLTGIMAAAFILLAILLIILIGGVVKRRNRVKAGLPANGKIRYSDINWEFNGQGSIKPEQEAENSVEIPSEASGEETVQEPPVEEPNCEIAEGEAADENPPETDPGIPEETEIAAEPVITEEPESVAEPEAAAEPEIAKADREEAEGEQELKTEDNPVETAETEASNATEEKEASAPEIKVEKIEMNGQKGYRKFGPENKNISRSGRVYTEEELRKQIRE